MENAVRCGIVLAGGSGQRLRSFVQRFRGDGLPKQYVRFTGARSLLEQTFDRVERLIPPERVFTVAGLSHLQFPEAEDQLAGRPPDTVVLQPENRETAPGVLLPLLHLVTRHPNSVVGIFPSDHFVDQDGLFMGYVDMAFRATERNPASLVLLGAEPRYAEPEYGYVIPAAGGPKPPQLGLRRVLTFVEKPTPAAAGDLIALGALWNTLVMTFRPKTLMDLIARVEPSLRTAFERIRLAIGSPRAAAVVEEVYRDLAPVNFSRTVLAAIPNRRSASLWVLPARGVSWCDWGSEQRIMSTLNHARQPHYMGASPPPAARPLPDVI
jgi:mannose-1-phosphate guanylyltransferase